MTIVIAFIRTKSYENFKTRLSKRKSTLPPVEVRVPEDTVDLRNEAQEKVREAKSQGDEGRRNAWQSHLDDANQLNSGAKPWQTMSIK
jgi:hypothetical protein